jgi:hypothetical protein
MFLLIFVTAIISSYDFQVCANICLCVPVRPEKPQCATNKNKVNLRCKLFLKKYFLFGVTSARDLPSKRMGNNRKSSVAVSGVSKATEVQKNKYCGQQIGILAAMRELSVFSSADSSLAKH